MMKRIAAIAALAVLGTVSAFAAKPVPPPAPLGPLVVVDSTGKIVGRLGSDRDVPQYQGIGKVFITTDGTLVAVKTQGRSEDPSKLYFWSDASIYFEGVGCQGTAYMQLGAQVAWGVKPSVMVYDGNTTGRFLLYIASGDRVARTLGSAYSSGVCSEVSVGGEVLPLSSPIDLTTLYLQPFTIR